MEATMDEKITSIGSDDERRVQAGTGTSYDRPPSWVILLSAMLVAVGVFGRQHPAPILANGDRTTGAAERSEQIQTPSQVPGRGWKDVLQGIYRGISEDRIFLVAAGVTFYAILALFPGIAAVVSIYGLFADPSRIVTRLDTLSGFAPSGAVDILREELTRLAHQHRAALGFSFAISMGVSLWSANAGVSGLFAAITAVYEEKEKRSTVKYYAITLAFTVGAVVLVLLSLAILIALPLVLDHIADPGVPTPAAQGNQMADLVRAHCVSVLRHL
jgi:uncharacterized BrkB/YihY/UPF0761 family membrane protein